MKKKKIAGILLGGIFVLTVCCGIFLIKGNSEELLLKENQKYVYGYITSIQGNEMTYMEMEESVIEAMLEPEAEASQEEEKKVEEKKGETSENAKKPDGGRGSRGDRPSGMPNMGSMPERMPNMENMPSMEGFNFSMEATSAITVYIPVGVTVHTVADTTTTFSRLANGDLLKILVETNADGKDIIEEIWMLQ